MEEIDDVVEEESGETYSALNSETPAESKCYQIVSKGSSRVAVFKDTKYKVKLGHWQYFTRGTKRYGKTHEKQAFCTFCDEEQRKPVCGSRPGLAAHLTKCAEAPESVKVEARTSMADYLEKHYGRKCSKTYHKEVEEPERKPWNGAGETSDEHTVESFPTGAIRTSDRTSPVAVRRTRSKRVLDLVDDEYAQPSPSLSLLPDDEVLTGLPAFSEESDFVTQVQESSSLLDVERLKLEQETTRMQHTYKMKKLSNRHAYKMEKLAVERLRIENESMLLKMQMSATNEANGKSSES